jgi:Putative DNA-binding domain
MERSEIEKTVKSYIEQDLGGQEIENPKCDFKAKWYDLKIPKDINEFLKDTSAIANTFGPDGLIIIGYDSKQKSFTQASFFDSNLKDTSYLSDLINKKIDRLFDIAVYDLVINGNKISVLHIPPSIDKPHVIRNYQTFDKSNNAKDEQHKIFVRKNTSTYPASKNDIELMFYDRKNIIPDYKLVCSYHIDTLHLNASSHYNGSQREITGVKAGINLVFENLGKRPVAVIEIQISFTFFENPNPHEIMYFTTDNQYRGSEIIVQPNKIEGVAINLKSDYYKNNSYNKTQEFIKELNEGKRDLITNSLILILSTGNKLKSNLIKVS